MKDKSLFNSKEYNEERIEYINECVREVCINGDDLSKYEKMIGKLFPEEPELFLKLSSFVEFCVSLKFRKSMSETSVANIKYLAEEIHVTDDTIALLTKENSLDESNNLNSENNVFLSKIRNNFQRLWLVGGIVCGICCFCVLFICVSDPYSSFFDGKYWLLVFTGLGTVGLLLEWRKVRYAVFLTMASFTLLAFSLIGYDESLWMMMMMICVFLHGIVMKISRVKERQSKMVMKDKSLFNKENQDFVTDATIDVLLSGYSQSADKQGSLWGRLFPIAKYRKIMLSVLLLTIVWFCSYFYGGTIDSILGLICFEISVSSIAIIVGFFLIVSDVKCHHLKTIDAPKWLAPHLKILSIGRALTITIFIIFAILLYGVFYKEIILEYSSYYDGFDVVNLFIPFHILLLCMGISILCVLLFNLINCDFKALHLVKTYVVVMLLLLICVLCIYGELFLYFPKELLFRH
ncbi:MAG: hypothetical protein MJZ32_10670 [Bacteroidaceae bacterium]|nr:hypothetical protein [Bacteroidaceae bacterium]